MEQFLRTHPVIRWTIILALLIAIGIEGVLIFDRLGGVGPGTVAPPTPEGPRLVTLPCLSTTGVNVRIGPSRDFQVITTILPQTRFTALGRNGDVPWLLIRLEDDTEGWLSSFDSDGTPLARCEGELDTLREEGGEISQADVPEPERTPEPTLTPEPTITSAPGQRLREGNGPDLHVARLDFSLALDGLLLEWDATSAATIGTLVFEAPGKEGNWGGPSDLSGTVRAAWDDGALYLAAQVDDDAIVQLSRDERLVRGDAVELFIDGDLLGDFDADGYNGDDVQMVLSPGDFLERPPSTWVYFSPLGGTGEILAYRDRIQLFAAPTPTGYSLEARIPWDGIGVRPEPGAVFGYAVALSDDDSPESADQEAQVSTTSELPFRHPVNWGNLILDP